jgi:hypothetical protein
MYSTSYSVDAPTFCSVTVVVKYRSFTPKDVDSDTFSEPPVPTHAAESRSDVDVSDTVLGVIS